MFLAAAINYLIPNLNVTYYMSLMIGYICCTPDLKLEASEH